MAATLAQLDAFIERVMPVRRHVLVNFTLGRGIDLNPLRIVLTHAFEQFQCFQWQSAGIKGKNDDRKLVREDGIGEYHIFRPKTARKSDVAKVARNCPEPL